MSQSENQRWPRLIAGTVMLLFAGIIYSWSILKAPLGQAFGWDNAQLGLNFTITMGFFCIGGIVGSLLQKKLAARWVTLIGATLSFLGFFLSSRLQGNLFMLYFSYGFLCGLGIGIIYNVVISSVTSWFPDKRATASGVMLMGFGASSLLLGSVLNGLFASVGWRQAYLIFGLAIFAVLFVGSFFMKNKTVVRQAAATQSANTLKDAPSGDLSAGQMLGKSSFWMFYLFTILISALGTGVISFGKDVALSVGTAESLAVLLVGGLSVSNGLSRIITGYLFDTIGRKKTMFIANLIAVLAVLFMLGAVVLGSVALVVIGMLAVGFSYGSMPTIASGYVSKMYGAKHFATNFSIANTQLLIASFSSTLSGVILRSSGSYRPIFLIFLGFTLLALLLTLLLSRKDAA